MILERVFIHWVFQIVVRVGAKSPPHPVGMELEILQGGSFLPGERNLRRNDFDNLNLFQSEKQLSVNTEHKLKPKLT